MALPNFKYTAGSSDCISYSVVQCPNKSDEDRFDCNINNSHKFSHISSFGVYDGHGGGYASRICSQTLHLKIIQKYLEFMNNNNFETNNLDLLDAAFCEAVRKSVSEINNVVRQESTSGCTMVSLFLITLPDESIRVFCPWIGDSRCVMYAGHTREKILLTEDHKPSLERERKRIDSRQPVGWVGRPIQIDKKSFEPKQMEQYLNSVNTNPLPTSVTTNTEVFQDYDEEIVLNLPMEYARSFIGRRSGDPANMDQTGVGALALFGRYGVSLTMTRSIGDREGPRSCAAIPDVSAVTINKDEYVRFVIGTDGLWDVMSADVVRDVIMNIHDPKKAAHKLTVMAWHRRVGKNIRMDDITVVVVDVSNGILGQEHTTSTACQCSIM